MCWNVSPVVYVSDWWWQWDEEGGHSGWSHQDHWGADQDSLTLTQPLVIHIGDTLSCNFDDIYAYTHWSSTGEVSSIFRMPCNASQWREITHEMAGRKEGFGFPARLMNCWQMKQPSIPVLSELNSYYLFYPVIANHLPFGSMSSQL